MRMLLAVAAGALGYCYYRGCEVRAHKHKQGLKEEVVRWEGEGGNVPAVATPSPAPVPDSSIPPGTHAH